MRQRPFLTTQGTKLVDREGETVILRGVGLGGWMNMENFITGYPANESAHRQSLLEVLGGKKYDLFFEQFLENFFTEDDAKFLQSLGLNLVRLPVNYHHFEDDMEPFTIKESGFTHLDRVIDLCAQHKIYTIIDLHAVPGYQNQAWHSDNPTHKALFWEHKHFQDRTVNFWETFARRYKDNPWVAGYNPINEPADPTERRIMPVYARIVAAIRAIDPDHIIFLEGNCYSRDFHMFGEPLPNVVYTNHDYALPGFIDGGPYPGYSRGISVDRDVLEATFLKRSQYMLDHHVPIWVGEFGPVYTGEPDADAMRYQVLQDQLEIYAKYEVNWALWTYKDIGLQGIAYTKPESAWIKRIEPLLKKKARLGVDAWGGLDKDIRLIMEPLEQVFAKEFPDYNPFPFGVQRQINRLVRHILLSEPLLQEFGECFRGISEADIHELIASFLFDQCTIRQPLAEMLRNFA
ncbi:MAG: cellulase family glycosylhydrolase [Candidatus Vecturithrix sp.]|jgi:aryl-phospho-beta-D-glucosidase BglC (GH1 family)|nr:cellulase family glycosylhydrolase [Candidatus Vecturithrix sp.]